MEENLPITIGRQYGSGGSEIATRLGELLGFKVYSKELISIAAEKKGVSPEFLSRVDEKATSSFLYTVATGASLYRNHHFSPDLPINDQLFILQTEIVKEAVAEAPAIFVGRCADYILRKHKKCINLFIYADEADRVARVMAREGCSEKQAQDLMAKNDKRRISYYNFYTGKKWGRTENYHLSINSSLLGIEGTAQFLAQLLPHFYVQNDENAVN